MELIKRKKRTGFSFVLSVVIHLVIVLLLITSIGYSVYNEADHGDAAVTPTQSVKAVAVDQKAVEEQVKEIQAAEKAKQDAAIAWQQHLQSLAHAAQSERAAAEASVQKLKVQQQELVVKNQEQMSRLNALKAEAAQKLQSLQNQQQALQTQNAAVAQRLAATKQALALEQSVAAKERLQQQLAVEQAEQQALAKQQLLNQLARYKTMILNAIGKQWIIPAGVDKSLSCEMLIKLAPDGTVLSAEVIKSSGNAILDQSAVTAVMKASPLPVPQNPFLMEQFKSLHLIVKPEGLLDQ